ncbi:hypothetical protein JXO59_15700, partial [candidate division KSB1 bacterium]|nr:hypothetical protein [candidate division KSB1 bacterium]
MHENYAAEIKSLGQYLGDHPESLLFARLAERYLRMKEIDKAIDICQRGLRNHPNYATGHLILAKCFLARKQYDEAEKRLKHVYSLEDNYLPAYKLYGELMAVIGRKELHYASFKQIQKIDPLFPVDLPPIVEEPEPEPPAPASTQQETPFSESAKTSDVEPPPVEKPLQTIVHIPEEEEPIPDFSSEAFLDDEPPPSYEPEPETDYEPQPPPQRRPRIEVDELPDAESSEVLDADEGDFEKEEERFSLILDDLFRPNIAEEEQREKEARNRLEKAVRDETTGPQMKSEGLQDAEAETSEAESAPPRLPAEK